VTEHQTRLDELISSLKEQGGRLTPQRMAVLKILATSDEHPTAEQIYERVREDFPMTSLATVYKTLNLLVDLGQVLEIGFCGDSTRYDGKRPAPHPHLVCVRCGKIEDLDLASTRGLDQTVAELSGYRVLRHRFDFFGICPECQRKE